MTIPACSVCGRTVVAHRSRRLGVCAACAAQAGRTRYGDLEHTTTCQTPQVVRFDGTRYAELVCRACGARAVVPRRTEWTDTEAAR